MGGEDPGRESLPDASMCRVVAARVRRVPAQRGALLQLDRAERVRAVDASQVIVAGAVVRRRRHLHSGLPGGLGRRRQKSRVRRECPPRAVQAPGRGDTDGPRRCRRQRGRRARGAGQGAHALSVGSRDGGWGRVPVRRRLAHRGGLFGVRAVGAARRDDGGREGARVGAGSVGRCAVGGD